MVRKIGWMAGATLAAALATPAVAQEAVRGKQAGDVVLGASVIGVLPRDGGGISGVGGQPEAGNAWTGQLDGTYFFTPQVALNLIAATTRHDLTGKNTALGNIDLGHVWALPPTLTAQFHPFPQARLSPYVGAGLNYTVFYSEGGGRHAAVTDIDVKDTWGYALNVGVDYELAPRWLLNVDAKYLHLRPDVSVNNGAIQASTRLDPWIVGFGVRYRF